MVTTFEKSKQNPEKYEIYKKRVSECLMKKYYENEEYRKNYNLENMKKRQLKLKEKIEYWNNHPEYAEQQRKLGKRLKQPKVWVI